MTNAFAATGQLATTGLTRSEAVRLSLIETASRLSDRKKLASEVALLEADVEDRAETLVVADLMEAPRAPG